ncbi:MAG: hypothetical protein DRP64_00065 [Verrucomicrobia bacterium]|nr:MAG: hypothetical protein DRP64_00065 [Verrucomicrobiota bacterium]
MNQLYNKARERYLGGVSDWKVGAMGIALVDANYTFDPTHEFLVQVASSSRAAEKDFTGRTDADGYANGLGVSFTALTWPLPITQVVIFENTGDEATDLLVAYYDEVTGFPVDLTGGDYSVLPDALFGGYFRL